MTAELRTIGDRLALYTDDELVYRRLREGPTPLYKIPYFQRGRMVAIDLYFDIKLKDTVARIMTGQFLLDIKESPDLPKRKTVRQARKV